MTPQLQRQSLGCGYEPRTDRVHLSLWEPPRGEHGYQGPEPTICAGYTARLPEVAEVYRARAHWLKGNAAVLNPSDLLLDCIVILDASCNNLQHWRSTPAADGGGGR